MLLTASRRAAFFALGIVALAGCNEQEGIGFEADQTPPNIAIEKTAGDTLTVEGGIVFGVLATDNLGLKDLSVTLSAGYTAQFDTTFTTAITELNFGFSVPLEENTTAGGVILITATITDGNDNTASAVDSVFLVNDAALTVRILDPVSGGVTAPDRQLPINIRATQETGIRRVGFTVEGVVTAADSANFPLPDTALFSTTLTVPGSTAEGVFTITGFAEDSSGRRATSSPVDVTVQQVVSDTDPPVVTLTIAGRLEVSDSVRVSATDPSGINLIGWIARDLNGTVIASDTTTSSGVLTQVTDTWTLGLTFTTFPQQLEVEGFAIDGAGNRGEARADSAISSPPRRDTVTVVNGITKPLPAGGRVADAIYNSNLNELYLTNVDLNRVEIFRIADTSYVAGGIRVGSQPWGIALWPADTLGTNLDRVVVANSGGVNLSIVDVATRQEIDRHKLPSFLVQSVQTEIDPQTNTIKIKILEFDFSDRPQYLGMTCRPPDGGTACAADSIFAVYSTTPTPGQTAQFANHGTVRWENITAGTPHSHFLFEQAAVAPSPDADSLQILIDRGPSVPIETMLSVAKGIMVDLDALGFQDTTFVRNSGNFTHALIGEGGDLKFARAVGYNGNALLERSNDCTIIQTVTICGPSEIDRGVTRSTRVRDFIANTATPVSSIAINFNGLTNIVRADSVYILDEDLFLAGIIGVSGGNPGMDLNFLHAFDPFVGGTGGTFGGSADPNLRMVFLARDDANIDVFDTFFFKRVTTIPVRDPIIGPLRSALLPSGEQILIGVTSRGVVTVRFPQIPNIFPTTDAGGQ